jgi:hypothetical protein
MRVGIMRMKGGNADATVGASKNAHLDVRRSAPAGLPE